MNYFFRKPNFNVFFTFIFISLFLVVESAEARRMGFGRSIGKQPPIKRQVTPPAPTKNAVPKQNASNSKSGSKSSFMGPLAGIVAGLGLAGLASYLGFGEELMGFILLLLGVFFVLFLFRLFFKGRVKNEMAFASPSNINNNNSHLLKENNEEFINSKTNISSQFVNQDALNNLDDNFAEKEVNEFLLVAKQKFVELQKLWDERDMNEIKNFCSPEMADLFEKQLNEEVNENKNHTSVVEINAELEGTNSYHNDQQDKIEDAYVHFFGLIREESDGNASAFSEVWTLSKNISKKSGWILTGITQSKE